MPILYVIGGLVSIGFHVAASDEQAQELLGHSEGTNHLSFVAAPGGRLLFAAADEDVQRTGGPVLESGHGSPSEGP